MPKMMKNTRSLLWVLGGAAIGAAAVGAAAIFIAARNNRKESLTSFEDFGSHKHDRLTKRFRSQTGKEQATAEKEMGFNYDKRDLRRGYDLDGTNTH